MDEIINWVNNLDWAMIMLYGSMPIISAIVGWGTNVVALKMTFYPLEFFGIKPYLGWQGIIPSKAGKMAAIAVDLITSRLITVEEVFSRLDPKRIAEELEPALEEVVDSIVEEVMREQAPAMWEMLPARVKRTILDRVKKDAPEAIAEMMNDIKKNINDLFDLKEMMVTNITKDKALLNEIFVRCGHKEFKFIENSGIYFGFLFGLFQMILWAFYKGSWVLPVMGFVVGYATNAIALKMIFRPLNPIKIGPLVIQGLFLKRQHEVAGEYGALIASEILNPQNITEAILKGPGSDKLFKVVQRHVKKEVDTQSGITKPFIQMTIGTHEYLRVKDLVVERVMEYAPETLKHIHAYTAEAMDIENTLKSKMRELSSEEFEGILRPCFQEDELTLILVGAALGVAVGFFQLFVMFGG